MQMRTQIQMTMEEIRAYLASQKLVILTSNGPDGFPHPMPMNFAIDDRDRFIITTYRRSQKVKNLERDPKASILAESGTSYAEFKSVVVYATTEIITDTDAVEKAMTDLAWKSAPADVGLTEDMVARVRKSAPRRVVLRLTPHRYVSWDHGKLDGRY